MVTSYRNPILRGMYPDPSICRVGNTYYLVNSTFEYYPGIALSKSTDLLNWQQLPGVVTQTKQADLSHAKSNEGIFAVCIRYFEGAFYVITTNFAEFKTFIIRGVLNNHDEIVWDADRVEINVNGIDPDLYFEDGRTYVEFTGYIDDKGTKAIQQVEIDLHTGEILAGPKVLSFGSGGRDVEGPHILKKDHTYYLLTAEGGTGVGHMITIFKSDHLWGPYENKDGVNPIFTNRDRAEQPLQNIGHGDLFQDAAHNWWLVCLGTQPAAVGMTQITNLGRETLLYPVNWNHTWPVINHGVPTEVVSLADFKQHQQSLLNEQRSTDFEDHFETAKLRPEWLSLRNGLKDNLKLTHQMLLLHGGETTLAQQGTPAFLGLRQASHDEILTVSLATEATDLKQGRLGIASLINNDHFAALLIEADQEHFNVIRQQQVADLEINEVIGTLSELPEQFCLINHAATKTFRVVAKNKTVEFTTAALNFSNEAIAALNTGDIEGLYALGNATLAVAAVSRVKTGPISQKE
ncbi:glycoside hydrolase family 43 protein [Lactobacillus selangorensis]|nr:glycoside hydrolase family 43 protein [Lactobacillus selangorensis]